MNDLPVKPLPEDAVDLAAKAVAAEVAAQRRHRENVIGLLDTAVE